MLIKLLQKNYIDITPTVDPSTDDYRATVIVPRTAAFPIKPGDYSIGFVSRSPRGEFRCYWDKVWMDEALVLKVTAPHGDGFKHELFIRFATHDPAPGMGLDDHLAVDYVVNFIFPDGTRSTVYVPPPTAPNPGLGAF